MAAIIPEKSAIKPQVTASGFTDSDAAEVNGKDIESGVRSSAYYATHSAYKRIRSHLFHRVNHQPIGTATAERLHQRCRQCSHKTGIHSAQTDYITNASHRKSIAPEVRNTAMPTRKATRYGMIRTAVVKPSLAPSTKESYTLIFFRTPVRINRMITPNRRIFAISVE